MPEYINDNPKDITPGEPIVFENLSESPVEVSAELVFQKDGDYVVSVRGGKIAVSGNDAPSAKRGRWMSTDMYMIDRCSECGFEIDWDDVPPWLERLPHFKNSCLNCGAKMDAEPPKEV